MRVVLIALIVWLALVLTCWGAGPQLQADSTEYNFGEVFQGEKVEKIFRFKNQGGEPLTIDRVRTSCGCTAVLLSATRLEPGQDGEIKAVFDSSRFAGAVNKTIYVNSNDPQQPLIQFSIRGSVRQEITVTPPLVDLGSIPAGGRREVEVVLLNQGDKPLKILGTEILAPDLNVQTKSDELVNGQPVKLLLRAAPKEGRARLNGYIIIKTDSPRIPELRIPVYGSVSAPAPQ